MGLRFTPSLLISDCLRRALQLAVRAGYFSTALVGAFKSIRTTPLAPAAPGWSRQPSAPSSHSPVPVAPRTCSASSSGGNATRPEALSRNGFRARGRSAAFGWSFSMPSTRSRRLPDSSGGSARDLDLGNRGSIKSWVSHIEGFNREYLLCLSRFTMPSYQISDCDFRIDPCRVQHLWQFLELVGDSRDRIWKLVSASLATRAFHNRLATGDRCIRCGRLSSGSQGSGGASFVEGL